MASHALQSVEPVIAKFVVPKGAKVIGHIPNRDGSPNYDFPIVQQQVKVQVKVPVLDRDGEQRWKLSPKGEPTVKMFKLTTEKKVVEWVPAYSPQGHIAKNFNFRPDPEEQKRTERAAKLKQVERQLAEALVDEDVDVATLVASLKGTGPVKQTAKKTTKKADPA